MTNEQVEAIRALREEGHAIAIFTPEELHGANADAVEDRLVELGWEVIDCLRTDDPSGNDF